MSTRRPLLPAVVFACLAGALGALLVRMAFLDGGGHRHGPAGSDPASHRPGETGSPGLPAEVLHAVGNAKCPIMGGDADPDQIVVLEGIGIGICCAGCEAEIRSDPAGTLRKLMKEEGSGPRLEAWLDVHPEVARKVGLAAEVRPVPPEKALEPARGRRLTSLGNERCPVDGNEARGAVTSAVDGLHVALCTEECRTRFLARPGFFVERLSREPAVNARIEAHRDLVTRGGHGPHWHCAACDVRSAAPGPCPACGTALARPEGEPLFHLRNLRCPIMGEPIEGEGALVEYGGLGVRICCPSCEETFRQYPDYYLAKLEREQGIRVPRIVEEER